MESFYSSAMRHFLLFFCAQGLCLSTNAQQVCKLFRARIRDLVGIPKSHWKLPSKEMKISKWWGGFQEAVLSCFCCFKTKRRSMEEMNTFSGIKWIARNWEPVVIHDILSYDTLEFWDNRSLEITAMMHSVKDNYGDLLDSTSELCLEDDTDLGDLGLQHQVSLEGAEVSGTLPSNETEGGGTMEKPADERCERKACEEINGKCEPSGEAGGGEQ